MPHFAEFDEGMAAQLDGYGEEDCPYSTKDQPVLKEWWVAGHRFARASAELNRMRREGT